MLMMTAISALMLAQAGPATMIEGDNQTTEVAYEAISNGENVDAIAQLDAALQDNPDDPALLINMGSAHAEMGEFEQAADFYRAAMESDVRYRLELADGQWVDSRRAASLALEVIEGRTLAMK